ncbi:MAG: galactokinase [Actinomycetota bacterium]|nr:galactokinase [Actinomycetota bacterium]
MTTAIAPGRVNLIGEHTDYSGGYVLPMAIDRHTVVELVAGGTQVCLRSELEPEGATIGLDVMDPAAVQPSWARYVAGVVAHLRPTQGGTGTVRTTLPVGAGLSSSTALVVATAMALGFAGSALELAVACQQAERLATGVAPGIMDQLASTSGVAGHALLIDCTSLDVSPVPMPPDVEVVVAHSGQSRSVATSAYAERRGQCEEAARRIGPLRLASLADVAALPDPLLRRRARHVVTENERVLAFAHCLSAGALADAGQLMGASHRSLRDDFEVSTPALDALVERLCATPGVYGARLTGAGFGGCVVALAEPGSAGEGWRVTPAAGAHLSAG